MFENGWFNIIYVCAKCGAEDTERRLLTDGSPIPVACNCWSCGAGRGKEPHEMIQTRKGMFPQPLTDRIAA